MAGMIEHWAGQGVRTERGGPEVPEEFWREAESIFVDMAEKLREAAMRNGLDVHFGTAKEKAHDGAQIDIEQM